MQLSILGPVLLDGSAPRGAKERALLARLLVAPGAPVPADTLIEAAWTPDRPDGVADSVDCGGWLQDRATVDLGLDLSVGCASVSG